MKHVEVYVDALTIFQNGESKGDTDLVLAFEWEDRDFGDSDAPSAFAAKKIEKGVEKDFTAKDDPQKADSLPRRIFKTKVEGKSFIKVTVLKKEELSDFGKLLGKLLNVAAVAIGGTVSGVVGAALAKAAAGEIVKLKEEWEYVLGEGYFVADEETIASGDFKVDLAITEQVGKALSKLHTTWKRDPRSVLPPEKVVSPGIIDFLKDNKSNGNLKLTLKVL